MLSRKDKAGGATRCRHPQFNQQTLVLEYTDVNIRITEDRPTVLQLTAYHGNDIAPYPGQHVRWDNIVVSRAPIGPMRGVSNEVLDITPPRPPSVLKVQ